MTFPLSSFLPVDSEVAAGKANWTNLTTPVHNEATSISHVSSPTDVRMEIGECERTEWWLRKPPSGHWVIGWLEQHPDLSVTSNIMQAEEA